MSTFLLAVPTYWTHPEGRGREEVFFDHPTPLDTDGTLRRTLDSFILLADPGVSVAVVAAATTPALNPAMEDRLQEIVSSPPLPYPVTWFLPSHLARLQDFLRRQGREGWVDLLSLSGYGAIRNLTLVLANLLEAEVLVSLDDDEIIEDQEFLSKISTDLALLAQRHPVFGLAGPYVNADGGVLVPEPQTPWGLVWPKLRYMNQTMAGLVDSEELLPRTPLALGGNMILPVDLCRRLPFDPDIPRGEDLDYVANAAMWGIPFFFDKNLRVVHLPPDKPHPTWLKLRQDLRRFAYARRKLREQEPHPDLVRVTPLELAPYPGNFLTDELEQMAYHSHALLALEYLTAGDAEGARQTLQNLCLFQQENTCPHNAFRTYLELAGRWQELQTWLSEPEIGAQARQAVWG
ncbi:MAG: hypothetical protein ACOC6L_01915 [Thermodesulfobacteriota bacterium]